MSGIAGAQEHADTLRSLDRCPQCGLKEGERYPTGKKVLCMPIGQGVAGLGPVVWCSETCRQEWHEDRQVRLP